MKYITGFEGRQALGSGTAGSWLAGVHPVNL